MKTELETRKAVELTLAIEDSWFKIAVHEIVETDDSKREVAVARYLTIEDANVNTRYPRRAKFSIISRPDPSYLPCNISLFVCEHAGECSVKHEGKIPGTPYRETKLFGLKK